MLLLCAGTVNLIRLFHKDHRLSSEFWKQGTASSSMPLLKDVIFDPVQIKASFSKTRESIWLRCC